MTLDFLVSALVTLFVVVDPLGLVPAFLALTQGMKARARRQVAMRAALIASAILIGFALVGDWLLARLGISLPAFRIAGGLLLFYVAFQMVLEQRVEEETSTAAHALEARVRNIAAFPLAIPLMAGPGAITATMLLAGQTRMEPLLLVLLLLVIAAIAAICLAVFLLATRIHKLFGATVNSVLSRLLGVVLAALAVQYVIDGVRAVLRA
jgi:multiple antibiotic resistance protein